MPSAETMERIEALRQEIKRVMGKRKSLQPHQVVEYARKHPKSELYRRFEAAGLWEDDKAAEFARLMFARHLIQRVKVRIVDNVGKTQRMRVYVNLTEERDDDPHYAKRQDVLSDEERREKMQRDAARETRSVARRYGDIIHGHILSEMYRLADAIEGGRAGDMMDVAIAAEEA